VRYLCQCFPHLGHLRPVPLHSVQLPAPYRPSPLQTPHSTVSFQQRWQRKSGDIAHPIIEISQPLSIQERDGLRTMDLADWPVTRRPRARNYFKRPSTFAATPSALSGSDTRDETPPCTPIVTGALCWPVAPVPSYHRTLPLQISTLGLRILTST
jgi:hypothetical protein